MRHRRAVKKLSRNTANRKALIRSLAASLIVHERISTTHGKAKAASSELDRLVTLGKRNTSTSKKTAIRRLGSKLLINKLFDDIAPRYANRAGGYTRIFRLMPRKGDGAKMAIIELTERKVVEKPAAKRGKKQAKQSLISATSPKGAKAETEKAKEAPSKAIKPAVEFTREPKKAQGLKTKFEEEKTKEKAKSEKRKIDKGFFKGLKRYFRGKADRPGP